MVARITSSVRRDKVVLLPSAMNSWERGRE